MDINTQSSEVNSSNTGGNSKAKIIILLILLLVLAIGAYYFSKKKSSTQIKVEHSSIYSKPDSLTVDQVKTILPPGFPIDPRAFQFNAISGAKGTTTTLNLSFTVPVSQKDITNIYNNYLKNWNSATLPNGKKLPANVIDVSLGKQKLLIMVIPPIPDMRGKLFEATSTVAVSAKPKTATSTPINLSSLIISYEK